MNSKYIIINTTFDNEEDANITINTLLREKLVSCAQTSRVDSKYHWQGKIENNHEILVVLKTKRVLYDKVEETILRLHNYKMPQIVAYPIVKGSKDYLNWIDEETLKEIKL